MDLNTYDDLRAKLGFARIAKPAAVGIAVLALMVAVFAGRTLLESATATTFEVDPAGAASAPGEGSDGDSPASGSPSTDAAQQEDLAPLYAHVAGCVVRPGLVELTPHSRVSDAIQAAGGFTEEASPESVNLARQVQDGEQIVVYSKDEVREGVAPRAAEAAGASSLPAGQGATGLVNLNTATESELESLPGIGPATARKIVDDRAANGPFQAVEDLKRVSGIGDRKFEAIADLVCV